MERSWPAILYIVGFLGLACAMNLSNSIMLYDTADAFLRCIYAGLLWLYARKAGANAVVSSVFTIGFFSELWNLKDELTGTATEFKAEEVLFFTILVIMIDLNVWHHYRCSHSYRSHR